MPYRDCTKGLTKVLVRVLVKDPCPLGLQILAVADLTTAKPFRLPLGMNMKDPYQPVFVRGSLPTWRLMGLSSYL